MVLSIVDELEDWEQLEKDMMEIDYPYDFKGGSDQKNYQISHLPIAFPFGLY